MEVDKEISNSRNQQNKSNLSLNLIYKKVMMKESFKNSKDNLRTLNYEKIAKYKMRNMTIDFLINSIFKFKNSIMFSNPIMKYIKNVKPYDYSKIVNNIQNKKDILKEYLFFKNNMGPNIRKRMKEKTIDLSGKDTNNKNYYYSRMTNIDHKKIINTRKEKIILIQKNIRGFLSKKIIYEEVNKIIIKKFIDKILIIQKFVREFLSKKKSLNNIIVNIIHEERKSKSNKITDLFSLYHYRNFYKKNLLIRKVLKQRHDSILIIQKKYKSFKYIKKVKEIISREKNVIVLTYPFLAESVRIKIYYNMSKEFKTFDFFKCPIRKYFVTYINKNEINSGEYLCHIIVNGNVILDKRYKYIVDKENIIYNLIYIGDIKPKLEFEHKILNNINNKNNEIIKERKKKRKKKKIEEEEDSEDFYYYCYNDNSNSTNSYSTKSFNDNKNSIDKNKKNSIDSQSLQKEKGNSIKSQKIKYNNILDELSQSISSSKSNFTLNKINLYAKKTHKTKFGDKKENK
jgi:hypothetical protein